MYRPYGQKVTELDRYETRRLALKALVDSMGRGGRAEVAKRIQKEASYVARLLYPPGKDGRKRIGDELMDALSKAYPGWLEREQKPGAAAAVAPPSRARAEARPDYMAFHVFGGDSAPARPDGQPAVVECMEMALWEVRRKLGHVPEPGQIQLFTQLGQSMRPLIEDGDIAFVDTAINQFAGDDCYLIAMGEDVQIKLLQRRGPELWVVSHNPDFPPWRAAEQDIVVLGKVVLRGALRPI